LTHITSFAYCSPVVRGQFMNPHLSIAEHPIPRAEPSSRRDERPVALRERAAELDSHLRRLARQEARARRVFGRLAACFLERRAHHRLGFARLGDWARERLGLSGREVQSAAQTVRALRRLPEIAAAFECGAISWTQLRMLITVTTPETQRDWLARARGGTVRALESSRRAAVHARTDALPSDVSAVADECADEEGLVDGEPRVRFRMACPSRVAVRWRHTVELARRVAGEPLPVCQAAEAIAAEGLSAAQVRTASLGDEAHGGAAGEMPSAVHHQTSGAAQQKQGTALPGTHNARTQRTVVSPTDPVALDASHALDWAAVDEALPADVERLERDAEILDPFALDERLCAAIRALYRIDRQMGRLLRIFFDRRMPAAFGFSSHSCYVRERLGISTSKARALVAIERRARHVPALAEAYREGTLSWLRALTILPVAVGTTAPRWVARANEVTLRRLVDEVADALEMRLAVDPADGDEASLRDAISAGEPQPIGTVALPRQIGAHSTYTPLDTEISITGPASVVGLLRAAIHAFRDPSEPSWIGCERLLAHVEAEWQRQPGHRDPIFERDGWRCAVPACSSRKNLHDHHIRFRSQGGSNAPENRVTICAWHHLRGIHGCRIRAWGRAPDAIRWQLGLRGERPPVLDLVGDRYVTRCQDEERATA
jgi:hypothetical protein